LRVAIDDGGHPASIVDVIDAEPAGC